MKILLSGSLGHMGREVIKLCEDGVRGANLVAGVDINADGSEKQMTYRSFSEITHTEDLDCIIDFSHHTLTEELLSFAIKNKICVVLCTTGHTEEEIDLIHKAAEKIPVFYSGNMSLGIALLIELAKKTAAAMPDAEIEIIEKHHNRKLDAPSGTALMISNELKQVRTDAFNHLGRSGQGKRDKNEIGIHSVRMGNIVGVHEVIIGTENQTITLTHEAHSRALFAEGALSAASFIVTCGAGLYDMKSIVSESKNDKLEVAPV